MSRVSAASIPPPGNAQHAKLIRNVRELCVRIVRGKASAQNASVKYQRDSRDRVHPALVTWQRWSDCGQSRCEFARPNWLGIHWGSVILLVFGIVSQIANQFQVAKRAADSESLALRCGLYETRLENMLIDDDPRTSVIGLLEEVNSLFEKEQYNQVLPQVFDKRD